LIPLFDHYSIKALFPGKILYAKECTVYLKWKYEECRGSSLLLEKIFSGSFDEEEVKLSRRECPSPPVLMKK
jgi:hypothetical protein